MTKPKITWSAGDERAAVQRGWVLSAADNGELQLQALDDPAAHPLWEGPPPPWRLPATDGEAWRLVLLADAAEDPLAMTALAYLRQESPREFGRLFRYGQSDEMSEEAFTRGRAALVPGGGATWREVAAVTAEHVAHIEGVAAEQERRGDEPRARINRLFLPAARRALDHAERMAQAEERKARRGAKR